MTNKTLNPQGWPRPKGYSNGVSATGENIFVAGQIGWTKDCEFESDDFVAQSRQALQNIVAVLAEADAGPEHITRMNWYITDRKEYLARGYELGQVYREIIGKHFPAMTAVQVVALIEERAQVEIEVTAVKPSS